MIKRLLAALGVAALILALSASPAHASFANCPAGTGCVYTGPLGQGSQGVIPYSGFGDGGCHNFVSPFNNNIESAVADYGNGHGLQFWTNAGCTGNTWILPAKQSVTWAGAPYVNAFSSFKIT